MHYKTKKRKVGVWIYDKDTGEPLKEEQRMETLYEWKAPDGMIYRSRDPAMIDRRRWRVLGMTQEEINEEIGQGKTEVTPPEAPQPILKEE